MNCPKFQWRKVVSICTCLVIFMQVGNYILKSNPLLAALYCGLWSPFSYEIPTTSAATLPKFIWEARMTTFTFWVMIVAHMIKIQLFKVIYTFGDSLQRDISLTERDELLINSYCWQHRISPWLWAYGEVFHYVAKYAVTLLNCGESALVPCHTENGNNSRWLRGVIPM